ncbi:pyridoxal-phosphate dependent enzyme [Pelagibacteraceae bacterium]|nr:pyridoxal-phosphate dependent enzyme [Pelagibacteraceae bacterium]
MKTFVENNYFGNGFPDDPILKDKNMIVRTDVDTVRKVVKACLKPEVSPLVDSELAKKIGVKSLWFKDERNRLGIGSFKAIGASYVMAHEAVDKIGFDFNDEDLKSSLKGRTFITASAGNHGISLAFGAQQFGAKAIIYLSKTVPSNFADYIRTFGAEVVIEGKNYEASMAAAEKASKENNWTLLSDSTWEGYSAGIDVMAGYLVMASEAFEQCPETPTHIFLQGGIGGYPASVAACARKYYGDDPKIVIVEPTEGRVLQASIEAGKPVESPGEVSNMGRLDCKVASLGALSSLAQTSNYFMTITDDEATDCLPELEENGLKTSESGGAGYAGLLKCIKNNGCEITSDSKVLLILTEKKPD